MERTTINVPILARLEGEGALDLEIRNNQIEKLQLRIYEPPRLFEKFLEGRGYDEVLDFVARICGICPVAYQMTAVHAIERIFDMNVGSWVREMRRVFYCGEWIQSHSLHIHFLAAPDYFGYASVMDMAKDYPNEIRRGLRLQMLGNELIRLFGARSVHPVGACVGGFFHAPSHSQVASLLKKLQEGLKEAEALIHWVAAFSFVDNPQKFISVSLRHPNEYPFNEGRIVSDNGLNIIIDEFENYFKEQQVPYSNALHCLFEGKPYLVGPLARINLNHDRLPNSIHDILKETNIVFPSNNLFHSAVARAVEIYYALSEAIRILETYQYNDSPKVPVVPKAGMSFGCTEAPRGMLWQRYEIDEAGLVKSANIVPPTSQNQARIEEDLFISLQNFGLDKNSDELRSFSEMVIRNYDPCISCSTHFLDLRVKRND